MLAARERLIALRTERTADLMRYRAYLRTMFAEFASNVDPVSGSRFAEVAADGNKARGDLQISVTFFEGTMLSIGVDAYGRFLHSANPERVLGDIGQIVAIDCAEDGSRARLTYDTSTQPMRRRTIEIAQLLRVVTEAAVKAVEADVVDPGIAPAPVAAAAPAAAAPAEAPAAEPAVVHLVTRVMEAVPAA
jgi:hypothetical protein